MHSASGVMMSVSNGRSETINIDVLICTYRRRSIVDTLQSVDAQQLPSHVALRAIVADNDDGPSAKALVEASASQMSIPVTYLHAPSRNISIARNACLDHASGNWIAFIDDDETATPCWIASLLDSALTGGYDGVFGPVLATYERGTPGWIRQYDYLSTRPMTRGGEVQTGYTGNALLRWRGGPYEDARFRHDKGQSGGEDTEFFFRLWRAGAQFGVSEEAVVYEAAEPARLNFDWIRKRKYRAGQSYGRHSSAVWGVGPVLLLAGSTAKIVSCAVMAGLNIFSAAGRRYWVLRSVFHCGVFAGALGAREGVVYGE